MGKAILEITDGTAENTINLIAPVVGYHLKSWRQARPDITLSTSKNWFSGYERPVSYTLGSHIEPFVFAANAKDIDTLDDLEAKFNRILLMAIGYWTDQNITRPFYLRVKNRDQSSIRYGTIIGATLHGSGNPFASPLFTTRPADDELSVAIKHSGWRDYPPGQSKDITSDLYSQMSSQIHTPFSFGVLQGNPVSTNEIHIANYYSQANISHIFRGGNAVNLQNHEYQDEFDKLLIYKPSDGYTYFGTAPGPLNTHTLFNNIVFNLWPFAGINGNEFTWEISVGTGAWLELHDVWGNMNLSPNSPVSMVTWKPMYSWETDVVNGVDAYWVRMSLGSEDVYQVGYKPFAASWPYIDVSNDEPGDAGVLLDIAVTPGVTTPGSLDPGDFTEDQPVFNRMVVGAREVTSENLKFIPYISPGLATLTSFGITWDATRWVEDHSAYGMICVQYPVTAFSSETPSFSMTEFSINYSVAPAYSGRFRVFLRLASGKAVLEEGLISFWLEILDVGGSDSKITKSTRRMTDALSYDHVTVLDLGSITLGTDRKSGFGIISSGAVEQTVKIMAKVHDDITLAEWINIYDLVIIPQDMWYADVQITGAISSPDNEIILSSATVPGDLVSAVRNNDTLAIQQTPTVSPGMPLSFLTHENIRLYFSTFNDWYVSNDTDYDDPGYINPVGVTRPRLYTSFNDFLRNGSFAKVAKFLGGRGTKGTIL